ncbi:MAG: hypothetical protein QG628_362 [Patescibacteria group bacterium]|jgi:hypothetical protein|nr:hypothetical protein [Patescibacteria group bacterium]
MAVEKSGSSWVHKPISSEEGAIKSGLARNITCVPDSVGVYHPFKEDFEVVAREDAYDMDRLGPIDFDYIPVDCPRFNKCSECPQIIGSVAISTERE